MNNIRLVAVKCYLHDSAILQESIKCISPFVDEIILSHGCWKGFTNSSPPAPVFEHEINHRNNSIANIAEGDYIFSLDDDDFTFGDWPKLRKLLNKAYLAYVWVNEHMASGNKTIRPKIFRKQKDMIYRGNHTTMFIGSQKIFGRKPNKHQLNLMSPVSIFHLDTFTHDHDYETEMITYKNQRDERF